MNCFFTYRNEFTVLTKVIAIINNSPILLHTVTMLSSTVEPVYHYICISYININNKIKLEIQENKNSQIAIIDFLTTKKQITPHMKVC